MRALEPIFAALFELGQSIASESTPLTTTSRRWIPWDQMAPENSPAFFQRQPDFGVSGGDRGIWRFALKAEWWIYLTTDSTDLQTTTSTPINNYATALINAIAGTLQGRKQTLGGLVENAYIDGKVIIDEGLISSPAVLFVPITILTGF